MKPTILVVGGAGYIGSHMVMELLRADFPVVILDDLSSGHRELLPGGDFVEGNLGDAALLEQLFSDYPVKAVMHFAASSLVGESVLDPVKYYRNNISHTVELVHQMQRHGVENFIFSSTAAVYGEPQQTPIPEDHPCQPINPYGFTKQAVEQLLIDCARNGDLNYSILRYFNAAGADASGDIGERHSPETHLIPILLQVATGERESMEIFGTDYATHDGTCIRDYVHVSDLAQAHLLALDGLLENRANRIYNLGNSKGHSVHEVVAAARRITGKSIPVRESSRRPGDPPVLVADSTLIRNELGWRPRYEDLDPIIETAWNWHRA
jgi:UDP-glucose 4-epimerase